MNIYIIYEWQVKKTPSNSLVVVFVQFRVRRIIILSYNYLFISGLDFFYLCDDDEHKSWNDSEVN